MKRNQIPGVPYTGKKHPLPTPQTPAVVLQPQTYRELQQGINLIAQAIRPTLGPLPRLVMMEAQRREDRPEILDDAATIARRIIQVKPRGVDTGAMLIRQALWKMHEEAGDGSATMAVIYQTIFNEGLRAINQLDCNAMLLRAGLESGLRAVLTSLDQSATPLQGQAAISAVATGLCRDDAPMAKMLGEIFDIVGPDGLIVVEKGNTLELEREYIEGTYWHLSGWFSRWLVTDRAEKRTMFEDPALLISDLKLTDPQQLVPVLEQCVKANIKRLVIVAAEVSDRVIGLLVSNNKAKTIETLAVRTPRIGEAERVAAMEDIAVLSGGRPFYSAAKETLDNFQIDDLGHARRAWATESLFGLFGGKGDPRNIRRQLGQLRGMVPLAETDHEKRMLQERLGRLSGGTAILRVGGITTPESEVRKVMAERAVTSLRNAILGGVVAGGGAALLNAQAALRGLPVKNDEAATAHKILARALEEPMRTIARNAGATPDIIIEKVKACPPGYGFDARQHQIINLRQTGILDAALVLKQALEVAVSGAAMALTTDVIVHHRKPKESLEP